VPLTDDSGYFWFFNPDNIEMLLKVLDACVEPFNHFWVFSAGLTNVEVALKVTDLATGEEKVYNNPLGQAYPPILDTEAFDSCDVPFERQVCVEFEDLAAGTVLGAPAGHLPGSTVFFEDGVRVAVNDFRWVPTGGTFNFAQVDPPGMIPGLGSGQTLGINNLGVEFDFSALGFVPMEVTFDFADLGGFENLAINHLPVPVYAGELTGAPCPLGGVSCNFTTTPGGLGTGTLTGPVTHLRIGGQEFWIDNVCARP
jgi:hypothetical protein